uniref:Uncharacterized protein n=1 Tax=Tetranychus urticae TaxID=32264 RepID=T1KHW2_TETUR
MMGPSQTSRHRRIKMEVDECKKSFQVHILKVL